MVETCPVCAAQLTTMNLLEKHMNQTHKIYSDCKSVK